MKIIHVWQFVISITEYMAVNLTQWAQDVIMTLFFRHIKVVTSSDWNSTSEWRQFCDVILTVIMQRQCDVVLRSVMVATFSQLFQTLIWRLQYNVEMTASKLRQYDVFC